MPKPDDVNVNSKEYKDEIKAKTAGKLVISESVKIMSVD